MFKELLISVVVMPVVLGMLAARSRPQRYAFVRLLAFLFLFDVAYLVLVYYVKIKWVG